MVSAPCVRESLKKTKRAPRQPPLQHWLLTAFKAFAQSLCLIDNSISLPSISPERHDIVRQHSDIVAILFALSAITIWAGWMSATRIAATDGIAPIDVAMLRYGVPAVMLAPVWSNTYRKLKHAPKWSLVAMLGWGFPFVWLVTAALERASVVHLATIVFCTMPVFAVLFERVFFATKIESKQVPGYGLIGIAALIVVLGALFGTSSADPRSIIYMLLASAGWAAYVVAFKHTGFSSIEAPAYVCVVSTLVLLAVKSMSGGMLFPLTWAQFTFNALAQGVLSGFVATILYTAAITRIGSTRTASFSVLMPLLGTAIAFVWLNESPAALDLTALMLGTLGVAIVNGVIRLGRG